MMQFLQSEKWLKWKSNCSHFVEDYLLNSSMHGLKYIGDVSLSFYERAFFFVAFSIVTVLSAYFISNVWYKWTENPIIIGLNSALTPLNEIPFPAVTICNMNQARRSIADTVVDNSLENMLLESVCNLDDHLNNSTQEAAESYVGKWSQFRNFLVNSSQPCNLMLKYCRYAMVEERCMDIFLSTLSDEGLCCTFNMLNPKFMFYHQNDDWDVNPEEQPKYSPIDWTPELGFSKSQTGRTYPRRVAGAGAHMGLTIVLDAAIKQYFCSSTNSVGFKVLLHTPTETPKISNFGFFIAPGQEVRAVVDPKINDASELIRSIPVKNRKCFFASEGNLQYFRTYSKKNCEMECEALLMEQHCDCVMYYMPKVNEDVKICSRKDVMCYDRVRSSIELENDMNYSCSSCLPGCYEYSFGRELTTAVLGNYDLFRIRDKFLQEMDFGYVRENVAVLHIFFLETSFRSFIKGEIIGFTEFLSNTGGLLGLFLGFSVLSIVEIIYFISIRPYYKRRAQRSAAAKQQHKKKNIKAPVLAARNKKIFIAPKIAWMRYDTTGVDDHYIPFPYTE